MSRRIEPPRGGVRGAASLPRTALLGLSAVALLSLLVCKTTKLAPIVTSAEASLTNREASDIGTRTIWARSLVAAWIIITALATPFVSILADSKEWLYVYVTGNVGVLSLVTASMLYRRVALAKKPSRLRRLAMPSLFVVAGILLLLYAAFGAARQIQNDRDTNYSAESIVDFVIPILDSEIGANQPQPHKPGEIVRARFPVHGPLGAEKTALVHYVMTLGRGIQSDLVIRPLIERRLTSQLALAEQSEKASQESGNHVEELEAVTYGVVLKVALEQVKKPLLELRAELRLEESQGKEAAKKEATKSESASSSVFNGFTSIVGLLTALLTAVAGCVVALRSIGQSASAASTAKTNSVRE